MGTKSATTLAKGLHLLSAIVADEGRSSLTDVAATLEIPLPTAHRLALTLEAEGFLERSRKGHYFAGPALWTIAGSDNPVRRMAMRLRPSLARLAKAQRGFAHFGILEEGMVTYLVKEKGLEEELFTAEKAQLEAYCSAIGKVLLAALPTSDFEAYLENGPFVALTGNTLTQPDALRKEIEDVRTSNLAFDRHEIRDDLFCIAVPVHDNDAKVVGAISISLLQEVPIAKRIRQIQLLLARIVKTAR